MKFSVIITEYNPFHNGHRHQIESVRNSGSDFVIIVMSGDFTQRGEPAITDKYSRTLMALKNGADLVIELPVAYATADAGRFALGGVSILNSLGVVDNIAFGVEAGNEEFAPKIADFLSSAPASYYEILENNLKLGHSYPVARDKALGKCMPDYDSGKMAGSNTILAIEYCQAINKLNSSIKPLPITRLGSDYNDKSIDEEGFSSASAIRNLVSLGDLDYELLNSHMPECCVGILKDSNVILPEDMSNLLHYKLITCENYRDYLDISDSFSDRIFSLREEYADYESFCNLLKSKNITHASVRRLLSHILLDIKCDVPDTVPYARVLGFRKDSSNLLSEIKAHSSIPMITKMADARNQISGPASDLLAADVKAANIYESIVTDKYGLKRPNEFTRGVVII